MKEILIAVAIVLVIVIPLSIVWVKGIDEALQDDTWEKTKADEDREQAEYLRQYMERQQEKKRRNKQMRDKAIGFIADIVMAVCSAFTKFLLWIRRR